MSDAKPASPSPSPFASPVKAANGDRDVRCNVARPVPAHYRTLLSARSLRFYDGTYRWNGGVGYWDKRGGMFTVCILSFPFCVCRLWD